MRVSVLALAVLVAAVSFVLLTGAAKTSSLQVQGTVKSSFRPAYDILVRPPNSTTAPPVPAAAGEDAGRQAGAQEQEHPDGHSARQQEERNRLACDLVSGHSAAAERPDP